MDQTVLCDGCLKPITEEEMEDAHMPHDADCPQKTVGAADCLCDNVTHAECCFDPDCSEG